MAITKRELNTEYYNLCNTDVYLEYDSESYNMTLCDDGKGHHNIVVTDIKSGKGLAVFDASTTGFIIQLKFKDEIRFFVSYFNQEKKKYYLQENNSELSRGALCPVAIPSIKYNDIYLGYGAFIINDEDVLGYNKRPGNRIYKAFQNIESRNFRKIHKDGTTDHPNYVHVTELIAPEKDNLGMTRNYDEITYGIDLETLDICTPIYSERMDEYFEIIDEEPDKDTLMYLDYIYGHYDNNKPGDVTIINKIIKPLMNTEYKAKGPNLKRLTRKRT